MYITCAINKFLALINKTKMVLQDGYYRIRAYSDATRKTFIGTLFVDTTYQVILLAPPTSKNIPNSVFYFDSSRKILTYSSSPFNVNANGYLVVTEQEPFTVFLTNGNVNDASPFVWASSGQLFVWSTLRHIHWPLTIYFNAPGTNSIVIADRNNPPNAPIYFDFQFLDINSFSGPQDVVSSMLTPIPPTHPMYELCQRSNNKCYYNSNSKNPTKGVFSKDPSAILGFSQPTESSNQWIDEPTEQTIYLGQPDDRAQLHNQQPSATYDSACASMGGQSPDTCATSPDKYCYCDTGGGHLTRCGLSCAPGLYSRKIGSCAPSPDGDTYIQNYQCVPGTIIGYTDAANKRVCTNWTSTGPPPTGSVLFNSLRQCTELFADCPPGFKRNLGSIDRQGCYVDASNAKYFDPCNTPFSSCKASSGKVCGYDGKTNFWGAHASGHCLGNCHSYCYNRAPIPPYTYYCGENSQGKQAWVQNQTDKTLDPPPKFYVNMNYGYASPNYCSFNTPYAN